MPDSSARAILLNRILIALGFVGLFISGYLSLTKYLKVLPVCGSGGGCTAVTEHASAYWFAIPVAYFGLAGYLAITGLAILREITGRELSKALVGLGFALSLIGLLASFYLQYTAFFVIGETCLWCLASAITMLATFAGHAMLFGHASDAENPVHRPRLTAIPFILGGLVVTGLAIRFTQTTKAGGPTVLNARVVQGVQLVPSKAHVLGEANAPVTIVEFADFCCPTCRTTAMPTRGLVKKYPGKVRLIYRHLPLRLEGHEMNYALAIASEYAAKQGKFWAFHEAAMTTPTVPATVEEVLTIAGNLGLDTTELGGILQSMDGPEFDAVFRDETDALKLGAPITPSFYVLVAGQEPKLVRPAALESEFESGEFAKYVK